MPSSRAIAALLEQRERQREHRLLAGDQLQKFDLVFASTVGTPLNGSNVTHEFQQELAAAGLRKVRFHDLRHSAATSLIESGDKVRQVQDQLGHSGPAYTHVCSAMKQRVADAMDALDLITTADYPADERSASAQIEVRTGVVANARSRASLDKGKKAA